MKDKTLGLLKAPVIRYLPDPHGFYERGVAPNGGQAGDDPTQPQYKIWTDTPARFSHYTIEFVIYGVPESNLYFKPLYEQWLEDCRHHSKAQVDDDASPKWPLRPKAHRPVKVKATLTWDWDAPSVFVVHGYFDGVPFVVEPDDRFPTMMKAIMKTRGDIRPKMALDFAEQGWEFLRTSIETIIRTEINNG